MEDNISNIDLEETKKPHRGNPNFAKKYNKNLKKKKN